MAAANGSIARISGLRLALRSGLATDVGLITSKDPRKLVAKNASTCNVIMRILV